ncbi:uncharacterized protein RCC_02499 [Ramularia collo-cygni]|uniref:Uncharacterized protein n=1 Tax=Ramularia collo-cygni TaxID=112498 RepID=A0A2D3V2E8_9PEZI|nr:uncharacterized protein RCC_02499 [Ramularia collo-cygni]CZT16664.1 uncharacterized protein RCC_02499 [Ramularia collo-cygni]
MNSLFASIFRRAPEVRENLPVFPYAINKNPYTCKRTWPPDFTQLSPKHKFRLERRYRRRAKLKWARPQWTKFVKLSTWASIAFVCVYGVLFLEIDQGRTPFDDIRAWYAEQMGETFQRGAEVVKQADDNSPVATK